MSRIPHQGQVAGAVIRRRSSGWQVMVYGGRDPLTDRKTWISRQVNGSRREAAPDDQGRRWAP